MDLLTVHDSVILCFGHLSDTGSLRYTELPNIDIFHCIIEERIGIIIQRDEK